LLRPMIAVLLVLCAIAIYQQRKKAPPASQIAVKTVSPQAPSIQKNFLALGAAATGDSIEIAINSPADLNYKSRSEVLQWRRGAVEKTPGLLAGPYTPSPEVFAQMADGAPWWGIEGQFYRGPGQRSIEGASEESRFLLNPYLLVAPEFNDDWSKKLSETEAGSFPLYCAPLSLNWRPKEAYAEVTYAADCIARRQRPQFDLIAFNARDLGLPYVYVSYAESQNVFKQTAPTTAYANPQFIHQGGSCGYPGGCNNMSPITPPIDDIQLAGLPATVVVWLWREEPATVAQAPDMRFVIHFR
jgi:hypothetical protein